MATKKRGESKAFLRWFDARGVTYFASGSNHPGEILGLARVGINPGATVTMLTPGAVEAIETLAGSETLVFLDSGAFSEVSFGARGPYVKRGDEITDAEWHERLNVYARIAKAIGDQAYLVAPDKVAFQLETFERQERFAGYVQHLAELGANILVPLQKGPNRLLAAMLESTDILDLPDGFIPSIPMKKDATSLEELLDFLRDAAEADIVISRLHLLGLGPRGEKAQEVVEAVLATSPLTKIYMDSVLIRSLVGRRGGKLRGPRELTVASDAASYDLGEAVLRGEVPGAPRIDAFVERFDELAPAKMRKEVRRWWGSIEAVPFLKLEELYQAFLHDSSVAWRKSSAIERVFHEETPDWDSDWRVAALGDWAAWLTPADLSSDFDWLAPYLANWIYQPVSASFYPPAAAAYLDIYRALSTTKRWSELTPLPSQLWVYRSRPTGPSSEFVVLVEAEVVGSEGTPVLRVRVDEA